MAKKITPPPVVLMGGIVDLETGVSMNPERYSGQPFTIGDSDHNVINWIQSGELLVSNQTLCLGMSWNELNQLGFISGRSVNIGGQSYLCRSIRTDGKKRGGELSWIFGDTVNEEEIWNWSKGYFWCWNDSETILGSGETDQPGSGFVLMGVAHWFKPDLRAGIGFRPVLEPLSPTLMPDELQHGQAVTIFGPGGSVSGAFMEMSSYDLILEPNNQKQVVYPWTAVDGRGFMVIDRSAIMHIQENLKEGK